MWLYGARKRADLCNGRHLVELLDNDPMVRKVRDQLPRPQLSAFHGICRPLSGVLPSAYVGGGGDDDDPVTAATSSSPRYRPHGPQGEAGRDRVPPSAIVG
jgi:hypothetical protein